MIVKKHFHENKLVLAVCDESLLGKVIEENKLVLNLSSDFYAGKKVSEEEFIKLVNKSYIVNAVGQKTISLLIKNKVITDESIKKIKNIPYSQIVFEEKKD